MKKESLKAKAYHFIQEKIISCEYAPGTILNEEALKEEIGVSRTPIRDALSRLEQAGLITIMPKKGIMVAPLSISDINMIFEVRVLIEPHTLKNYGFTIPDEYILKIYEQLRQCKESPAASNNFKLDDMFHEMVLSALPNRFLLQTYDVIQTQNLRFRVMTGQISQERMDETIAEHLEITKYCLQKDWDMAAEAMRTHLLASKKATFDLLLSDTGYTNPKYIL